jgi:hypothetical protein
MIQVLQENKRPSLGQKFSNALGVGLQGANQLYQQHQAQEQQKQRNSQLSELLGYDVSQLPENMQMEALKNKFASQLQGEKFGFENEATGNKLRGEQEQKEASKKITQGAFDRIAQLIPKVGKGSGVLGMFGGKQAEHTGEFTSLTGALEAHLVDMVNKGTLSNTRFKYITETLLPKPTDTQDEIKGKMKGLAQILDLDPSVLGSGPISKEGKRPPLTAFQR